MKFFATIILCLLGLISYCQEMDKSMAKRMKVHHVYHATINHDTTFSTSSYDEEGKLIEIKGRPSLLLWPVNSNRITTYTYKDTLLQTQVVNSFIADTICRSDSTSYSYDQYGRVKSVFYSSTDSRFANSLHLYEYSPMPPNETFGPSSYKIKHYESFQRNQIPPLHLPTLFYHNQIFYLSDYEVLDPGYDVVYYTPCETKKFSDVQAFCFSKMDKTIRQGDSLRQTLSIKTSMDDLLFEHSIVRADSGQLYSGTMDIVKTVTDRLINDKVVERVIFDYDRTYTTLPNHAMTISYTYNSKGLLETINSKETIYVHPKHPPLTSEQKELYRYDYY